MKLPEIDKAFGIGQSTGQQKSKDIRRLLKIRRFDHRWTLPSQWEQTPGIWLLELNGFIIDIRDEPVSMQRAAFEKGLIPYIPAERTASQKAAPAPSRLLQFKITLRGIEPPIWRRIQVPFQFQYEYDFGDGWFHDLLYEGSPPPQPGVDYPQCLEGARACPPEDVGGVRGYKKG